MFLALTNKPGIRVKHVSLGVWNAQGRLLIGRWMDREDSTFPWSHSGISVAGSSPAFLFKIAHGQHRVVTTSLGEEDIPGEARVPLLSPKRGPHAPPDPGHRAAQPHPGLRPLPEKLFLISPPSPALVRERCQVKSWIAI